MLIGEVGKDERGQNYVKSEEFIVEFAKCKDRHHGNEEGYHGQRLINVAQSINRED